MTPGTNWIPDDTFLDRVKRAYRLSSERFRISRMSVWREIFSFQKKIHDALVAKSNEPLRDIFSDPVSTDLFYGVDNLCASVFSTDNDDLGRGELEGMRRLADILEIESDDPEQIILSLDKRLAQPISFPNPFRGEIGLDTLRGRASYRAVQAIYQAIRLKEITPTTGRVLEIGPGTGRTAAYAFKAGIRDYTTIDLPIGTVAQACFLGATIGPENIWLLGDDATSEGKIKILPVKNLGKLKGDFDVVFNADSLVEMSPLQVLVYLNFIRRRAAVFLSINHEYRKVKIKHFATVGLVGKKKTRSSYGMRPGYFEEVFT